MAAMMDEANKHGMRVMHHAGVEETNAWDDIKFGTTSIEHWYGIPDAAIESGRQNFPSDYNYNDEVRPFPLCRPAVARGELGTLDEGARRHGRNKAWRGIRRSISMKHRVICSARRRSPLSPNICIRFWRNISGRIPANHGSYFIGWTSTDEAFWKENYRIWMKAVYEFERRGGVIGTGEDAGFIYQMYGFGLLRELELHQEAGFHPLKVIQHATGNSAKILGKEDTTRTGSRRVQSRPDRSQRKSAREFQGALAARYRRGP